MPTIHPRSAWTTRPPTGTTPLRPGALSVVDIHWPAHEGRIGRDRARIVAALRSWQDDHMDRRGWRDIAYSVAVDLAGDVWILRGWDVQDGGVADRSDDVTVLLIMGMDDKMTPEMKAGAVWAMDEHERRRGRPLRRTWHGALSRTDCPGPEATAWARAGFPITTTTQEEEEMPLTDHDLDRIYDRTWNGGPGLGLLPQLAEGSGAWPATILGAITERTGRQVATVHAAIAGLTAAVQQLAGGQSVDLGAITAAAQDGAAAALAGFVGDLAEQTADRLEITTKGA